MTELFGTRYRSLWRRSLRIRALPALAVRALALPVMALLVGGLSLETQPADAAPQRKSTVRKSTTRKSTARKSTARKSTARKSTARRPAARPNAGAARPSGPTSPEARRRLAIEYVKQAATAYERGDYRRTIQLCDIAADWYPTYARAHVWMGAAHQKLGNHHEARMAYRWAKSLSPSSADAARADRGLRELGPY